MAKQYIGRVRAGEPVEYSNSTSYSILDRVEFEGGIYECKKSTAAGESPLTTPAKWILLSLGITKPEFEEVKGKAENAPINIVTPIELHVADGGSDTADLGAGRGSEEMPFLTLMGAYQYVASNYVGIRATIILHKDAVLDGPVRNLLIPIVIQSDSTRRTITLDANIDLRGGCLTLDNVNVDCGENYLACSGLDQAANLWLRNVSMTGSKTLLYCLFFPSNLMLMGNCSFTGTSANARALSVGRGRAEMNSNTDTLTFNGQFAMVIQVASSGIALLPGNLTGSATGKRYDLANGATLNVQGKGAEAIPGSIAGTCDASSKYI